MGAIAFFVFMCVVVVALVAMVIYSMVRLCLPIKGDKQGADIAMDRQLNNTEER